MAYGLILEEGQRFFTDLSAMFEGMGNIQDRYNWLISGLDTNADYNGWDVPELDGASMWKENAPGVWMSGEELTALLAKYPGLQFLFGVFSGFEKDISKEQAMAHPLPYADCNPDLWKKPVDTQNPLATVEIVPWDSSLVLVISRDRSIIDRFRQSFPMARDLEEYIDEKS